MQEGGIEGILAPNAVFLTQKKEGVMLGFLAGALQALGYVLYIRQVLRKEIEPNPATWLMFAYGTGLLGVLEFSRGAGSGLLILPATCAAFSVVVAAICWKRGILHWPKEWQDQFAFGTDIVLTLCYMGAWALAGSGVLSESERGSANLAFLVCSNLTTITSFSPLLRGASHKESPVPWVVWTYAYTTLAVVTFFEYGLWTELMIYPVLNAILHARVAWLAQNRQS